MNYWDANNGRKMLRRENLLHCNFEKVSSLDRMLVVPEESVPLVQQCSTFFFAHRYCLKLLDAFFTETRRYGYNGNANIRPLLSLVGWLGGGK